MPDLVDVEEPVELLRRDDLAGGQLRLEVAHDGVHHVGRVEHHLPGMPRVLFQQLRQGHPYLRVADGSLGPPAVVVAHRAADDGPLGALLAGALGLRVTLDRRDTVRVPPCHGRRRYADVRSDYAVVLTNRPVPPSRTCVSVRFLGGRSRARSYVVASPCQGSITMVRSLTTTRRMTRRSRPYHSSGAIAVTSFVGHDATAASDTSNGTATSSGCVTGTPISRPSARASRSYASPAGSSASSRDWRSPSRWMTSPSLAS